MIRNGLEDQQNTTTTSVVLQLWKQELTLQWKKFSMLIPDP